MNKPDILPDSRAKIVRGSVKLAGMNWCPLFCANCGVKGGLVMEDYTTFAFWLCQKCEQSWAHLTGTMAVPDEVVFAEMRERQLEREAKTPTSFLEGE